MSFEKKYEEWKKKQTQNKENSQGASFEDRYTNWQMRTKGDEIVGNLSTRFESWLSGYDSLAKDYYSRYKDVDTSAYRSDSADWLSTLSSRAQSNWQEALEIKGIVDQYKNYLDPEWVSSFYKALTDVDKAERDMISGARQESNYWSQWESEEAYTTAMEQAKAYKELTLGYDPSTHQDQGKAGWEDYVATQERIAQNKKEAEKSKSIWEKIGEWLGEIGQDSSLPLDTTQTISQGYKDQEAKKARPDETWDEEEKYIYGYLWKTNRQKATEYAMAVNNKKLVEKEQAEIKKIQDWATANFGAGAAHTVGAIMTAPLGMADFLGDIIAQGSLGYIPEADGVVSPFEYSQAVTGGISQKLNEYGTLSEDIPIIGGKGWGDIYGLGTSIAQSAVSAYTSGPIGTAINFFGSSSAGAVDDALARGANGEQAVLYGLFMGAAEAGAEYLGVDNLFKVGASKGLKDFFKNVLKQAGAEGMEEGITALLGNIADNVVMQDKSNFNALVEQFMSQGMSEKEAKTKAWLTSFEDIAFDTLAGAVSGAVHAVPHTAIQTIKYNNALTNTGKDVLKATNGYDALKTLANEVSSEGLVKGEADIKNLVGKTQTGVDAIKNKTASKHQANKTAKQVGKLSETVNSVRNEQNLAEIQSSLEGKGLSKSQAKKAAQLLNEALYTDGAYSKELYKSVMNDEGVWDTLRELVTSPDSSLKNRNLKHKLGRLGLKVGEDGTITSSVKAEEMEGNYVDGNLSFIENASEREYTASADGRSIVNSTGETVDIVEVASMDNGQMMLKVKNADGTETEVNAKDVSYASESEALVYEAVANMGLNAVSANSILKSYNPSQDAATFARGVQEAYRYGKYNYSEYEMYQEGNFLLDLTEAQIQKAYKLGQIQSGSDTAVAVAKLKEAIANSKGKKGEGKVHYEGDAVNIKEDSLNDRQKTGLKTMEMLSKALGIDFYVYASYVNKNGERVYKDETGKVKPAPNGKYDKATGAIHIDLNAGDLGEGTMLFTVAHELTHFIRAWSPAKFKVLANLLVEQYGKKGVSVEKLVRRQMAHMKASGRKNVTYDLAFEEFVADSMQTMLKSGNVMEFLAETKRRDEGLWNKIKEFFSDFVENLKKTVKAYDGYGPDTVEGQTVAEMSDVIEQFEKLFAEGLADASENFRAISYTEQQTLAEVGIGFDEETRSVHSLRYSTGRKDALGNVIDLVTVGKKNFNTEAIAQLVAKGTGRSIEDARKWVNSEITIANIVMNHPEFLDFEADDRYESIKKNSDYPQGTVDLSNLCPKRTEFTAMFDMLQKKYPDKLFTANDVAAMRNILKEKGITVACGACFVEDRRQLLGEIADTYIGMWKEAVETGKPLQKVNASGNKVTLTVTAALAKQYGLTKGSEILATDKYIPTQYDLTTYEGFKLLEKNHPTIAMGFNRYNNSRGQQAGRLIEGRAEYNRQILGWSPAKIKSVNNNGGLRIFSFSDFEVVHLLDLVQVIIDCSAMGVKIQGYTKIPSFARLIRNTGIKINRSLIPKGQTGMKMVNGKQVLDYDTTEGIDINDENFIDERNNPNVGNILIGINPTQIGLAMLDDFVDYIIPFHTNKSKDICKALGLAEWVNYKESQHEKDIDTGKASKHNVNIYTEVINKYHPTNKVEFVDAFLKVCKAQKKIPRYSDFLNKEYKADGTYHDEYGSYDFTYREGYHKLLVDFKMFDHNGNILPQGEITPNLDDAFMAKLLKAEVDKKKNYEFPQEVYDRLDKEFGEEDVLYSSRFKVDKYFSRQIDKWESLKDGSYVTVGTIIKDSPLNMVGMPDGKLFFDVTKIKKEFEKHDDHLSEDILKQIPKLLAHPIAITEYKPGEGENTVNVYGKLYYHDVPIVVGVVATLGRGENVVTKIRTVHAKGDIQKQITDDSILYLGENKKETNKWFQAQGQRVPTGGTKYGFIRSIARNPKSVNTLDENPHSDRNKDSEGHTLSKEQIEFFKDSKVRDEDGNLLVVRHGTDADFNVFDFSKAGKNGKAEGYGFYFSDDTEITSKYGAIQKEVYLNITKPLYNNKRTISRAELTKFTNALIDFDVEKYKDDGLTWQDSFLSNYVMTYGMSRTTAVREFVNAIWEANSNDQELVLEIAMADGRTYESSTMKEFYNVLTESVGYDGIIAEWSHADGTSNVYVTFNSEQSKYTTNQAPTSNPDLRYSDRNKDSVSNRSLLANALESAVTNEFERKTLNDYKEELGRADALEKELGEIRSKIRELSFAKGPKDTEALKKLREQEVKTVNRIDIRDKKLLRLEATKPLKDIIHRERQKAYKRAEKEGKEALAKYREKTAETQRELLNRWQESRHKAVEGRNKTAMRHKIRGIVSELNNLLLHGTKDKHVMIGLQKAVASALDAVNMDTVGAEERVAKYNALIAKEKNPDIIESLTSTRDRILAQGNNIGEKLANLKNAYSEIKNSDDPLIANSYDEVIFSKIEAVVESVGNTPIRDMSMSQLEDVYDLYKMVLTTIRNSNKAFKAKKGEEISVLSNRVMEEVEAVGGKKNLTLKATEGFKKYGWSILKPVYAFKLIGSKTFSEVFDNVRAGEDTWAKDVSEAKDFRTAAFKKYNYKHWDFNKKYTFTSKSGTSFELTLEQMLSLYAYSKRKQADDHLEKGGFVFDTAIEVTEKKHGIPLKYNVNTATAHQVSKETLAQIIGNLTTEQKGFVDEMQDYLSTVMGEKGNEVSLEMYGVKLFKEKFYFPLKSARQFMFEQNEVAGEVKIKNSGFSKETVAHANNPIILNNFMDVWANHVNDMSMYHSFVLALEDFNRVYNYKTPITENMKTESVKEYLQNAYGTQSADYIKQLLTDLNGGARSDPQAGIINKAIGKFKKAKVFASLSVVIQQPSALGRAFAYVDPKYFVGKKVNKNEQMKTWSEVKKYAPVAIIKEMGYFDVGNGRSTVSYLKGDKSVMDYVDDVASWLPAKADELTWCTIWDAVKRETADKNKTLKADSEALLKAAGERFTEVIVNTQVYDSVLSRSGMMRSKDTGVKMATAFMAEPTTSMNMMIDAHLQSKRGNKKFARKIRGGVVASIVINSILVSLVYASRDDDEDESYIEKYLGSLTSELIDGFNPLTYLPYVKDLWSIAQGYDVERSDMSVFADLVGSFEKLFDEDASALDKVTNFTGDVTNLFGLPLKNVWRDVVALFNVAKGIVDGTPTTTAGIGYSVMDSVRNAVPIWGRLDSGPAKTDKLYNALVSGDKTQIDRIKGGYKDEKAYESAVKKAIRENDKDVKNMVKAYASGDFSGVRSVIEAVASRYGISESLTDEIIDAEYNYYKSKIAEAAEALNEGKTSNYKDIVKTLRERYRGVISQDEIIGAIQKKSGEPKEEVSEVEETESVYETWQINSALENGDTATATTMIEDILRAKTETYLAKAKAEAEKNGKNFNEKTARKEAESKAQSSVKSSITSYWKPLVKAAKGNTSELYRIRELLFKTGFYGKTYSAVYSVMKEWMAEA